MIGKKKLGEVKAEVAALLRRLPGRSPRAWLDREAASAKRHRNRDVETLEMLCAALDDATSIGRRPKSPRKPAKR